MNLKRRLELLSAPDRGAIVLYGCVAALMTGCTAPGKQTEAQFARYSEAEIVAESLLDSTKAAPRQRSWESNVAIITASKPLETPAYWARVVSDDSYSKEQRQACLNYFFLRQVPLRTPIARLANIPEFSRWVSEHYLYGTQKMAGRTPLEVRVGEPIFAITVKRNSPVIMPVYFRLTKRISTPALIAVLRGEMVDREGIRISEIWTSVGRLPREEK